MMVGECGECLEMKRAMDSAGMVLGGGLVRGVGRGNGEGPLGEFEVVRFGGVRGVGAGTDGGREDVHHRGSVKAELLPRQHLFFVYP